jgi:hypothetical protein
MKCNTGKNVENLTLLQNYPCQRGYSKEANKEAGSSAERLMVPGSRPELRLKLAHYRSLKPNVSKLRSVCNVLRTVLRSVLRTSLQLGKAFANHWSRGTKVGFCSTLVQAPYDRV